MRTIRLFSLGVLVLVLGARGIHADDERDEGAGQGPQAKLAAEALGLLRLRMEARLEAARVLERAGRIDEALAALKDVESLHAEGLKTLEALLTRLERTGRAPAEQVSDAPFAGPAPDDLIGIGSGAGGAFRGRGGQREDTTGVGGSRRSQDAVENGLRWLAAHQSPTGAWEAENFGAWCDGKPNERRADGTGKGVYDVGVTGLALCAFLGAGYTNRGRHPFSDVVQRGLQYLKNVQDSEGCFGPRTSQHFIYNHGTAALAMVEAYGMTGSPLFQASAQKALDFIALARNPYFAWRYGVKPGDNDTSVTGWMLMSLKSAKLINEEATKNGRAAPLVIDESAFDGVRAWLDKMTDPDYGRVGYIQRGSGSARPQELIDRFPAEKTESMTAVGVLARIFLGEDPRRSDIIRKGLDLMGRLPPKWNPADGSIDMYYWYYGTLANFQAGGMHWKRWNDALRTAVLGNQRADTDFCLYKGSWDPIGPWGPDAGRVYSTALLTMTMEVYYRYDRVFGADR